MLAMMNVARLSKTMAVGSYRMMSTRLEPLFDRVLVKKVETDVQPIGGIRTPGLQKQVTQQIQSCRSYSHNSPTTSPQTTFVDVLEREIQDESAELSRQLSTDQFPGFSVETDESEVKLTKQVKNATVNVRFTVSSSLNEWSVPDPNDQQGEPAASKLLSLPEFQVQISKGSSTLELSCFFEEDMSENIEEGEAISEEPYFCIDELVYYEGEPKETSFAVSAEFFEEELQNHLLQYLAEHGIDDTFTKNLIAFSTSYEKKQYVGLLKCLKNFVSK